MTDLYKKIADEYGITRQEVKSVSFHALYGGQSNVPLENQIRSYVESAIKLGIIKIPVKHQ